jgi:hypothetical protein
MSWKHKRKGVGTVDDATYQLRGYMSQQIRLELLTRANGVLGAV